MTIKAATLVALACTGFGGAALAAPPGATVATLQLAPPVPVHRVIDGRAWDCHDQVCIATAASGAESQPVPRECNRAARQLGPFAAYQTGARALTDSEVAKCNAGAKYLANG